MIILKRMYYSEIEQKEFNVISDIYHSGLKRTYKKQVGKIRRNIGDKLAQKYRDIGAKGSKLGRKTEKLKKEDPLRGNREIAEKLVKEAKDNNIGVFEDNLANSALNIKGSDHIIYPSSEAREAADSVLRNPFLSELMGNEEKELYRSVKNDNALINLRGKIEDNPGILAHEIGHHKNFNNPITRFIKNINNKLSDYRPKSNSQKDIDKAEKKSRSVLNKAMRRIVDPIEETNANRNAVKLLKSDGATKEQIDYFNKLNKEALKTHKNTRNLELVSSLIKKIQIPSRVTQKHITPQTREEREFYNKYVLKRRRNKK